MRSGHLDRAAAFAVAAVLSGCGSADATVEMQGRAFAPATLTVPVGSQVVWKNRGPQVHTTTSDESLVADPAHAVRPVGAQSWSSGELEVDREFSHVFTEPGEHVYVCLLHEGDDMIGVVAVEG